MRRRRHIGRKAETTYAFVVDGKSEVWYLNMLKRNEPNLRFKIKPEIPDKKNISQQFELVKELVEKEYPKIYWIVDFDQLLKEARETPIGRENPIQKFIEYQKIINEKYKNVVVITNNPCLEFWFLLHFQRTSRVFSTCAKVENQLKSHLKDYEKTQRYYTKQDNDIYTKLKPYLKKAIDNACSLGHFDSDKPNKALSEMFLFFGSEEMKQLL